MPCVTSEFRDDITDVRDVTHFVRYVHLLGFNNLDIRQPNHGRDVSRNMSDITVLVVDAESSQMLQVLGAALHRSRPSEY